MGTRGIGTARRLSPYYWAHLRCSYFCLSVNRIPKRRKCITFSNHKEVLWLCWIAILEFKWQKFYRNDIERHTCDVDLARSEFMPPLPWGTASVFIPCRPWEVTTGSARTSMADAEWVSTWTAIWPFPFPVFFEFITTNEVSAGAEAPSLRLEIFNFTWFKIPESEYLR